MNQGAKVMKHLSKNVGKTLYCEDIAKAVELTPAQVQSTMNNLRRTNDEFQRRVVTVIRGNAWRYEEDAQSMDDPTANEDPGPIMHTTDPRLEFGKSYVKAVAASRVRYEHVRDLNGGRFLIQDQDGNLYVATRVPLS